MSQQHFSAPPSELVREAHKSGCEPGSNIPRKQTREEYRKLKELEELRKAGSAPAAVDEQGHDINPHIPQYMVDVPWYVDYDHSRPTLRHQRIHPEKKKVVDGLDKWYLRGQQQSEVPQKFKRGSCENCGATTHSRKDCLERPRKIGARYGGGPILPDEFIQPELNLSWDGKRDRWNGVDISWHQEKVLSEFNKLEEVKKTIKHRVGESKAEKDPTSNDRCSDDDEDDEDKYVEEMDMPGQKVDSKQRISVRNLRIREDTAKYLLNLDPNSAYYDPKSRSMRENPFPQNGSDNILFTGDNFVRASGDAQKFSQSQLFAWESYEKGIPVHLQADPTKLQLLHREFREKKNEYISDMKKKIVETYGGEEHLQKPPRELLSGNENYVEYNRKGQVIVGDKPPVVYSRYEEDVFVNGHTTIWGSFYKDGKWGYACCRAVVRNSYCTGNLCAEDSVMPTYDDERGKSLLELHKEKRRQMKKENPSNESKNGLDQQKVKEALKQLENEENVNYSADERKRSYNSLSAETASCNAPSAEEIEAYRLKRIRAEDPMRDYISKSN